MLPFVIIITKSSRRVRARRYIHLEAFEELQDDATPAMAAVVVASGRSNRTRFIIVATVVVLALGFMIWAAFGENTRYFLTVSEFNSEGRGSRRPDGPRFRHVGGGHLQPG